MERTGKISSCEGAQRTRHMHLKADGPRVRERQPGPAGALSVFRSCRVRVRNPGCQVAPKRRGWTRRLRAPGLWSPAQVSPRERAWAGGACGEEWRCRPRSGTGEQGPCGLSVSGRRAGGPRLPSEAQTATSHTLIIPPPHPGPRLTARTTS